MHGGTSVWGADTCKSAVASVSRCMLNSCGADLGHEHRGPGTGPGENTVAPAWEWEGAKRWLQPPGGDAAMALFLGDAVVATPRGLSGLDSRQLRSVLVKTEEVLGGKSCRCPQQW